MPQPGRTTSDASRCRDTEREEERVVVVVVVVGGGGVDPAPA